MNKPLVCPCGSGNPYPDCCERLHKDPAYPSAGPEALMRSRYAAFTLGLDDYLLDTWYPATRPARIAPDAGARQWLGLKILQTVQQSPEAATVEFVARSRLPGQRADRMHEVSRFVFEAGRWFYIDGDVRNE